jgi:hypothetical protein
MKGLVELRHGVSRLFRRGVLLSVVLLLACDAGLAQQATTGTRRARRRSGPIKQVKLPDPDTLGSVAFEEALIMQQAIQVLAPNPLSMLDIGQLAWAGQGLMKTQNANSVVQTERPVSSDMQLLFVTYDGIYRYVPLGHLLEQMSAPDVRAQLASVALGQQALPTGCGIVIAREKLRASRSTSQARRLLNLRVGQTAQIIQMQAAALGLASLVGGDLDANLIKKLCGLERNVEPLHVLFVGYRPGQTPEDRARHEHPTGSTQQ